MATLLDMMFEMKIASMFLVCPSRALPKDEGDPWGRECAAQSLHGAPQPHRKQDSGKEVL